MGLSSSEDRMIVAGVVLTQCQRVTDGRTDRRTDLLQIIQRSAQQAMLTRCKKRQQNQISFVEDHPNWPLLMHYNNHHTTCISRINKFIQIDYYYHWLTALPEKPARNHQFKVVRGHLFRDDSGMVFSAHCRFTTPLQTPVSPPANIHINFIYHKQDPLATFLQRVSILAMRSVVLAI